MPVRIRAYVNTYIDRQRSNKVRRKVASFEDTFVDLVTFGNRSFLVQILSSDSTSRGFMNSKTPGSNTAFTKTHKIEDQYSGIYAETKVMILYFTLRKGAYCLTSAPSTTGSSMQFHSAGETVGRQTGNAADERKHAVNVCLSDSGYVRALHRSLRNVASVDVSKVLQLADACPSSKRNKRGRRLGSGW